MARKPPPLLPFPDDEPAGTGNAVAEDSLPAREERTDYATPWPGPRLKVRQHQHNRRALPSRNSLRKGRNRHRVCNRLLKRRYLLRALLLRWLCLYRHRRMVRLSP